MENGDRARSRSPPRGGAPGVSEELRGLKAFVVNLDRRTDRWARVEKMLQKETPWLEYERLSASDGSKIEIPENEVATIWNTKCNAVYGDYDEWVFDAPGTPQDKTHWKFPCDVESCSKEWHFEEDEDGSTATVRRVGTRNKMRVKSVFAERYLNPGLVQKMSGGERGCAHSHRRLWEIAAAREGPTLALEDDASLVFTRNGDLGESSGQIFTERLRLAIREAPADFDVLYLGWSGWRGGHYKLLQDKDEGKAIKKVEYVWTTVAYVISQAGAKKLLVAGSPVGQPVDNFMAWEASQGRLKSFVVVDEGDDDDTWAGGIVDQLDFQGDSDVQKSDGGLQGDDAKDFSAVTKPKPAVRKRSATTRGASRGPRKSSAGARKRPAAAQGAARKRPAASGKSGSRRSATRRPTATKRGGVIKRRPARGHAETRLARRQPMAKSGGVRRRAMKLKK